MIYLDATFFVRLYVDEPGFEKVRGLVQRVVAVRSSILAKMETEAALHRQLREGRFNALLFREANAQFADDCAKQFIEWLPLTPAVVECVRSTFLKVPSNVFLRAGDAIHLATASEAGFKEIYSNDRHLLAAASLFKLKGINPLAK
jgi:predicted nucleic acid-binding protein